jgi:hypothetical protein
MLVPAAVIRPAPLARQARPAVVQRHLQTERSMWISVWRVMWETMAWPLTQTGSMAWLDREIGIGLDLELGSDSNSESFRSMDPARCRVQ